MTHTEQETRIVATGTLTLSCPDRLTEGVYSMRREGFVTYHLEGGEPGELTRIVFRNQVTGRCLDVEIPAGVDGFVLELLDTAVEIAEDAGRPWRRQEAQAAS